MINKPAVAGHLVHIDSGTSGNVVQVATSARELIAVLASAGGTAVAIRLHDVQSSGQRAMSNSKLLICANTGESTPFTPAQPMPFSKGICVVFEQGGQVVGSGEITLVLN